MDTVPRILLVEDDPVDLELMKKALGVSDLMIEVARDGVEAIERLRQDPAPALVVIDLKMPRLGGLETIERIKSDAGLRYTPIIVLSGSGEEQDILQAYRAGANGYVVKPMGLDGLRAVAQSIRDYWVRFNVRARR